MTTILQEYRNIVHDYKPNAKLKRRKAGYAIVDGGEDIVSNEISLTVAWREASAILENNT